MNWRQTAGDKNVREAEAVIERKNVDEEFGMWDVTIQDHLALSAIVSLELRGRWKNASAHEASLREIQGYHYPD